MERPTAPSEKTPDAVPRTAGGRLFAMETSGRAGSIAAVEVDSQGKITQSGSHQIPPSERSAKALAPAIEQLLKKMGWEPASIGAIGVAVGPGSFTGLRIGVTTAKVLAYATGADLLAVNTLAVLAEPEPLAKGQLWAVLDAQRGEWFAAPFPSKTPLNSMPYVETLRLRGDELSARLRPGDIVVGPSAGRMEVAGVSPREVEPSAESVARLAVARWMAGEVDDPYQLVPEYHRVSAAEENFAAQQAGHETR